MTFNRANSECPCRLCIRKGCGRYHDICLKYMVWREKLDERNAVERVQHKSKDTMSEAKKRSLWRSKRYQRQLTYPKKIDTR